MKSALYKGFEPLPLRQVMLPLHHKRAVILKNVYIKSHLSILRVPRGKNAQYQYVKDLSTLHKEIHQGLYVLFGPLVSEAVFHFAKCPSWLRFTIQVTTAYYLAKLGAGRMDSNHLFLYGDTDVLPLHYFRFIHFNPNGQGDLTQPLRGQEGSNLQHPD